MQEYLYPETWAVGDKFDAETANRRIRDQNRILLRRPMTEARITSNVSAVSGSNTLSYDTIDTDDDGMCITDSPVSDFYIQRDGTYAVFLNVTAAGNGSSCPSALAGYQVNGSTRRWDEIAAPPSNNGIQFIFCSTGILFLSTGEYIRTWFYQNSGSTMVLPAVNHTPRLVIMWLGMS